MSVQTRLIGRRLRRAHRVRRALRGTAERPRISVHRTNLHIYAAMRGQSLEDFQKTRNAQVLYSVAS